jgi:predicted nucleic acid-binding OB-fold protein
MAELIGSELSSLRDFYLSFSNDVVVIAKRRGLAESVNADRIRRRVVYYDETYSGIRNDLPDEVSGFVWGNSAEFLRFINPILQAAYLADLTSSL